MLSRRAISSGREREDKSEGRAVVVVVGPLGTWIVERFGSEKEEDILRPIWGSVGMGCVTER